MTTEKYKIEMEIEVEKAEVGCEDFIEDFVRDQIIRDDTIAVNEIKATKS